VFDQWAAKIVGLEIVVGIERVTIHIWSRARLAANVENAA